MQAAGGASLSDDQQPGPDRSGDGERSGRGAPVRRAAPYLLAFGVVGVLALAADQVTKALVVGRLVEGEPVRVMGGLLRFTLVFNPGAAFSTGTRFTVGLTVLATVAAVVVVWFAVRARTALWSVGLGLLLAGILGNLADRLFRAPGPMRGHVVDFLQLPHWPVFNVADMCINVGAVVLVVQAFRGVRINGSRSQEPRASDDETPDAPQHRAVDPAEETTR